MARFDGGYSAEGGETMGERGAIPAGEYVATLVKSDLTPSKANPSNKYIACEFAIHEGEFEGRRFWTNLNLWNGNAQAVEIAQRELNSIMHACGRLRVDDTEELHGIPMRVKLKVKADPQYGDKNEVASYAPLNDAGAAPRVAGNASGTGPTSAPWKKSA